VPPDEADDRAKIGARILGRTRAIEIVGRDDGGFLLL
jgi:hypothetical protein